MTFTARLRDELARSDTGRDCCRLAETAAVLRLAGALELRGGPGEPVGFAISTPSAALARRLLRVLREVGGSSGAEVEVHRAGGLRKRPMYRLRTRAGAAGVLASLGVLDEAGRPQPRVPDGLTARPCDDTAYLRGALMASGSCSAPLQVPHLEIGTPSEETAVHLAAVLRRCDAPGARAGPREGAWRVVVKSGAEIGNLLARAGAHDVFLAWDQGRLRRELRGAANRVANADRANLARAVGAAGHQVQAIERLTRTERWNDLAEALRAVALARLANPESSLSELGELLDPPVAKATVHRRLRQLMEMQESEPSSEEG